MRPARASRRTRSTPSKSNGRPNPPRLHADRRYYAELTKASRNFAVRMDRKKWCDLHHQHFDWDGKGDTGRVHRVRHLNALLRALRRARVELSRHGEPHQVFAYIDLGNSSDDALYVHTPNPNGSVFPNPIEEDSVACRPPPVLRARVDPERYDVRRSGGPGSAIYYVIPRTFEQGNGA